MISALHWFGIAVLFWTVVQPSPGDTEWAASPEAVFMTGDERKQWDALRSEQGREDFKAQYWSRRDPTPETSHNEFQDLVRERLAAADRRYSVEGMAGSRTQRGRVFVLLGAPGAERILAAPVDATPRVEMGRMVLPRSALDAREWHTWIYDRDKTPDVLERVGRHTLELAFIVEPGRRDELQSSTLYAAVRRKVAAASIVRAPGTSR